MHALVGSITYVAPEILKGNYSKECDLWSFGVILHLMVTGNPPFIGINDDETMKLIENYEFDFN